MSKFDPRSNTSKYKPDNTSPKFTELSRLTLNDVRGSLSSAIPIWQVLNLTEEEYYEKYPEYRNPAFASLKNDNQEITPSQVIEVVEKIETNLKKQKKRKL